jgi:hypothetical protein
VCARFNLDPGQGLPNGLHYNNNVYLHRDQLRSLPRDLLAKVHRHEFSHALLQAIGPSAQARIKSQFERVTTDKALNSTIERPVTKYGATDHKEYFCESVSAYLTPPREFPETPAGVMLKLLKPIRGRRYWVVGADRSDLQKRNPSVDDELRWLFSEHIPQKAAECSVCEMPP